MANQGFADGISGNGVKVHLNGIPVLALRNFGWKIKRDKKPLRGAGYARAHGVTRSIHKEYELNFEIAEVLNNDALREAMAAGSEAAGETYIDPTDIRNATIVVFYPEAPLLSKTFTGVEITDCEGDGISNSADAQDLGLKCSGFCTGTEGVF